MKNIIVLCNYPLIYKSIKSKTDFYKISIIAKKLNLNRKELLEYFDKVIEVEDIYDKYEIENIISQVIDETNENIEAIYSPFEGTVEIAGYLREKFGVKGNNEETSILVRDKYLMKKKVREKGIKTCESSIINNIKDIDEFILEYGYPLILKPILGYGTRNTFKIENKHELEVILNKLTNQNIEDFPKGNYVLETYISGTEYHCDSVVNNGEVVFASISEYLNNCIETVEHKNALGGIVYPDNSHNDLIIQKIKELNRKVISVLNIDNSVCHLEVFVDNDLNVYFGEIAARIGGGGVIPPCIKNIYNLDLFDAYVDVHLGRLNLDLIRCKNVYTGYLAFPTKNGKIKKIAKEEDYKNDESIIKVKIFNSVGDVIDEQCNTENRTGYIIIENENYEDLRNKLLNTFDSFKLEVED